MPNYVINKIAVKREYATKAEALIENGIAATLLPMPEHLNETKYPGDSENWYDWCVQNWGTKWGDFDIEWNASDNTFRFVTAWAPFNDNLLEKILEYFDGNIIYWWEEESGFGCEKEWKDFSISSIKEWEERQLGRTYND